MNRLIFHVDVLKLIPLGLLVLFLLLFGFLLALEKIMTAWGRVAGRFIAKYSRKSNAG